MPDTDTRVVEATAPLAVVSLIFQTKPESLFKWPTNFQAEGLDFTRLDSLEIADIEPAPDDVEEAARELRQHGYRIEARTEVGLSFSGTRDQFERDLGFDPFECGRGRARASSFVAVAGLVKDGCMRTFQALRDPDRVVAFEVAVPGVLASPGVFDESPWASPPPVESEFIWEPVPTSLVGLRSALEIPSGPDDPEGTDIRVRLVDSGFAEDWKRDSWPLQGDRPTDVHAIGKLDPTCDESGHGTAVAAHILAIAPKCTLSMRKCVDESGVRNYPVAAFQHAVGSWPEPNSTAAQSAARPHVIVCPWVIAGTSVCLQLEIANAVRHKIFVVFASGNSKMRDESPESNAGIAPFTNVVGAEFEQTSYRLCPIAHPDVLSVGGATKVRDESPDFQTTDYTPVAAHFKSKAFVYPGGQARNCPDLVGLTAREPDSRLELPGLISTPTSVGSTMDRKPDPDGARKDGSYKSAGTSMCAGQLAGMAALLLEAVPVLQRFPASVKNVLTNTARRDEEYAWDKQTGHGIAYAKGAMDSLQPEFDPFIRTTLGRGDSNLGSPDIIVLQSGSALEAARRLGQCFKHVHAQDLSEPEGRYVFVRVQNRGKVAGTAIVTMATVVPLSSHLVPGEPVRLEPGCFTVVGPFELPGPIPIGGALLADVVERSKRSALANLVKEPTRVLDRAKKLNLAVRKVVQS